MPRAEKDELQNQAQNPKQRDGSENYPTKRCREQFRCVNKRYVCHDEKEKGQADVEDLHDRAVDARERGEVFLPMEDTPEEEVKDGKREMEDSAREEEGLRSAHAVDFNRLNSKATRSVAVPK